MNISNLNNCISLVAACNLALDMFKHSRADGIYGIRESAEKYYFIGINPYTSVYGGNFLLYIEKKTGVANWFHDCYEKGYQTSAKVEVPEEFRIEAVIKDTPCFTLMGGYDYAYIYDKRKKESTFIDNFNTYPLCGIIDNHDEFCVLLALEKIVVYFMRTGEKKTIINDGKFMHGLSQINESIVQFYMEQKERWINVRTINDGEFLAEHDYTRQVY